MKQTPPDLRIWHLRQLSRPRPATGPAPRAPRARLRKLHPDAHVPRHPLSCIRELVRSRAHQEPHVSFASSCELACGILIRSHHLHTIHRDVNRTMHRQPIPRAHSCRTPWCGNARAVWARPRAVRISIRDLPSLSCPRGAHAFRRLDAVRNRRLDAVRTIGGPRKEEIACFGPACVFADR